jgi:hypothetical protein
MVNSFLIHLDTNQTSEIQAELVFGESILGLILYPQQLQASHAILGAPGTVYPATVSNDASSAYFDIGWYTVLLNMPQRTMSLNLTTQGGGPRYSHLRIITAAQMPDYNGNGQVEQGDLDLVLLNWGKNAIPAPSGWVMDLPYDTIDQDELDGVLLNWGTAVPESLAGTAVPEPSTALVAAAWALLGAFSVRRRRRRLP